MGPTFRTAEDADLDVLVAFMRQYYALDHLVLDATKARLALRELIQDASLGRTWLICDGTTAVGYMVLTLGYSLEYHGRDAFLDEFFIQASHRGRGWGRKALQFLEEAARALRIRAIHLEVTRANGRAQQFYRRLGFEDHDRYLMTKWMGEDPPGAGS